MASLLIIGGSGFFGKSILDSFQKKLLEQFGIHKIYVIARNADILTKEAPHLLSKNVFLLNVDIGSCTEIPMADYVIHAAASTDEKNYISRPQIERKNILSGTLNFCQLAPKYCRNSKIVFVSSGAVYGQQHESVVGLEESALLSSIDSLPASKQDYALAKRESEQAVIELGKLGLSVSIARCFAFVGKFLPRDRSFAIGNFVEDGLNKRTIKVNARNKVLRSYLEADDLVEWLLLIASVASTECPVFNVGSDEEISIQDLALKIANKFNVALSVPEIVDGSIDRYIPSIERARLIGCTVHNPLDMAIDKMIASLSKK